MPTDVTRFVSLADGERPIRDFHVAKVTFPVKMEAHITVTNKRVICYGVGGRGLLEKTRLVQEVHLDKVYGLDALVSWQINIAFLVSGILMVIFGVFLLWVNSNSNFLPFYYFLILIVIGIILLALCLRRMFYVIIKTVAMTPEIAVVGYKGFGQWRGSGVLMIGQAPGPDATALAQELGAVILDVQAKGDTLLKGIPMPPPIPAQQPLSQQAPQPSGTSSQGSSPLPVYSPPQQPAYDQQSGYQQYRRPP